MLSSIIKQRGNGRGTEKSGVMQNVRRNWKEFYSMGNRYNPDIHHRQSIRLKAHDYAATGAYFITICAHERECLFGEIVDGEMLTSQYGQGILDIARWEKILWVQLN